MSFIDNFFISIFSKEIGKDQFGNKYYESKKLDYLGQARRQVVYKGKVEASKVPPMWHAWLHYMNNEVPINNRPLAKLAYAEEFEGDASPRTAAYSSVREDSSTASLSKLPAEVELGKRSNDKFDWQQDYLPNLTGTSLSHKIVKNKTTKAEYSRWQPLGESNLGESK